MDSYCDGINGLKQLTGRHANLSEAVGHDGAELWQQNFACDGDVEPWLD